MSLHNRNKLFFVRVVCVGMFVFLSLSPTIKAEKKNIALDLFLNLPLYSSTLSHSSASLVIDSPATVYSSSYDKTQETLKPKKKYRKLSKPWRAAMLSMVVPGLGQLVYAKGYIRAPVYWAVLSFIALGMFQEWNNFKNASFAYNAYNKISSYKDSTDFYAIKEEFKNVPQSTLKNLKSEYRKQFDDNLVYFILIYVVQVIDAGVFTHLRNFDVSDDLSMGIELATPPLNFSPYLAMNPLSALQPKFTFSFKHRKHKRHATHRK